MSEADFPDPEAVARRDMGDKSSDLAHLETVVLKEGPRSKKIARYLAVKNRHTSEVHHHALTLETGKKRQGSWELDDKHSISFSDEDGDEIGQLTGFLNRLRGTATAATPGEPVAQLVELMQQVGGDVELLRKLVKVVREQSGGLDGIVAALNLGRYTHVLERLKEALAADEPVQDLLSDNPWLLGREYGEPLAHDDALLCRGTDGGLTLTVVDSAAIGAGRLDLEPDLTLALAQVLELLTRLAAERPDMPLHQLQAVLVIGRDGDDAQQLALERLNAHLERVEVLTFDALLRRGQAVLQALRVAARKATSRATP